MLTKAHLQYRLKGKKVVPLLLEHDAVDIGPLEKCVGSAAGRRKSEILPELKYYTDPLRKTGAGLAKIAMDLLECNDTEVDAQGYRWEAFAAAQTWRRRGLDMNQYHNLMLDKFGTDWQQRLFADIEPRLAISNVKPIRSSLVDRYNCAQVQGLIMLSESITGRITGVDLPMLRALVRAAKFFQILFEVRFWDGNRCEFAIEGPLQIFQKSQAYGVKLASFFPYVLQFPTWQIEAHLTLKDKPRILKLDQTSGLASHYLPLKGFIPEEFAQLENILVKELANWSKLDPPTPINLGGDQLIIPDITLENQNRNRVHIEFFHKWHRAQLCKRLDFLRENTTFRLVLVAPRSLYSEAKIDAEQVNKTLRNAYLLEFTKNPSVKKLAEAVNLASD